MAENVLIALECCANGDMCNSQCPYDDNHDDIYGCTRRLAKDALELLKEQRAEIERLKEEKEKAVEKTKEDITEYDKQAFDSVYFEGVGNGMRYALEIFTGSGGEHE